MMSWLLFHPMLIVFTFVYLQSNTYQAIVTTDGSSTYTVYTYFCMHLDNTTSGRIGYYIDPENFIEHRLSIDRIPYDISCENVPVSPWTNVIYRLSGVLKKRFMKVFHGGGFRYIEDYMEKNLHI